MEQLGNVGFSQMNKRAAHKAENRPDPQGWTSGSVGAWLVYGLCLGVFFIAVWQSGITRPAQRETMAYVSQAAHRTGIAMRALCDSAEIYWNQYPDVAKDDFFGRSGKVGCNGAYEHWIRHGRQEGRAWQGKTP